MKSCADDKARERMISAQRDHVLELCESDHVRFTNASRVGLRTNRLEEDRALPAQSRPKFVRTSLRPMASGVGDKCWDVVQPAV
jgi:hypothetical protein